MNTKDTTATVLAFALAGFLCACKGRSPVAPDPPSSLTLKGTITSGGSPMAGVTVYLSWDESKSTVTDANGAFSFSGLNGRFYVVTPSKRAQGFVPPNYEIEGGSRADLNFAAYPPRYGTKLGDIAPDFTALDQTGQPVSLYSYFGQVVFMDFSADWCAPCLEEALAAEALYQTHKSQGLRMLTLLIDGSPASWAAMFGLSFPVLDDDTETIGTVYGAYFIPLNVILDRNMVVRYKIAGYDEGEIRAAIKKYL